MFFYDEKRNPMEVGQVLHKGKLFLVATLPSRNCSRLCVGLFLEDDENFFLKTSFDSTWLRDLELVAKHAADPLGE